LTFKVSSPSTFSSFAITSSNTVVNQMAPLDFIFTTSNFIPQGAILELIFPSDLPISQVTLNSINGITKIQPIVSYSINNQNVLMTNAISSYYTSQDIHYFIVNSIQNPVILTFNYFLAIY